MAPVDYNIVKMKNLIGIVENPVIEDLLWEIVSFLDNERTFTGEFKKRDAYFKTRVRINSDFKEDLEELVRLGYLQDLKYSSYKVIKHLWEKSI